MTTRLRTGRRPATLATAAIAAMILLAGCSTPAGGTAAIDDYPGLPDGVNAPTDDLKPFASWLDTGKQIAITLYGSSGCPPVGVDMRETSPKKLEVDLEPIAADKACTADYAPHTTVFATPDDVDTSVEVSIVVKDETIILPPLN